MTKPITEQIMQIAVYGEDPEGTARDDAVFYVYSVGMEKFERPDLLVRDIPQWLLVSAMRGMNEWCDYFRRVLPELGETIGDTKGNWPYLMELVPAPKNYRNNQYGLVELKPVLVATCDGPGHEGEKDEPNAPREEK